MLTRKGLFTRLSTEGFGVDGHSLEYIRLWRRVLDEQLLAMIGSDKEMSMEAIAWFNSKPGDVAYFIDDHTEEEVKVDNRREFERVCSLAGLDPSTVTQVANTVLDRVKKETKQCKQTN